MNQTTDTQPPPVTPYMTDLHRPAELPLQPTKGFVCPAWCIETHDQADVDESLGVRHFGKLQQVDTSRGGRLEVRLGWFECLGDPLPARDLYFGPYISFDGDDGSGYGGFNELDALDVPLFLSIVASLVIEARA